MPKPEGPPPGKSLLRRAGCGVAILIAVLMIYRVTAVYVVRPELCAPPERPATVMVHDTRDGRDARYPPRAGAIDLIVMSYNMQGQASLLDADHLEEIAEVIRETDADIVGLQEVHDGTWQARFEDQASALAELTGMNLFFGRSFDSYGGSYGNAILTRGTIERAKVYPLPGRGEPRSLLEGIVTLDGREVTVYVTHLASWGRLQRASRSAQVNCIVEIIERSEHPFVLLGDFNTPPGNPEITPLTSGPLVRQAVNPSAATHILTQQHLDYIFPDSGWDTLHANVLTSGPADHWPVVARLASRSVSGPEDSNNDSNGQRPGPAEQGDAQ